MMHSLRRQQGVIRSRAAQLIGALLCVVVVTGVFATSLAVPSGTTTAVPRQPLAADVLDPDDLLDPDDTAFDGTAVDDTADAALVTFVDSSLLPEIVPGSEPGDDAALPTATLDSGALGAGDTITLLRPAGRRDIDIAVSDGLVFTGFRTSVLVPSAVHEIQLDMAVDGTSVFSATVAGGSTEELTFTLDSPIAADATLTISVEERYGATCTSTAVEPSALRLVDNEFFFERIDSRPETIADFFPPVLSHGIVVFDPDGETSLRSAALELATALSRRYSTMPIIDVRHRSADGPVPAPPVSDDPFARTIVIVEDEVARMSVMQGDDGTYLEIAGPPGLIEEMAAAVSEPELAFITKASVQVEELAAAVAPTDLLGQRSLRDVGVRRLVASGSRVLELPISLPQAAFGEPVDEIQVRLGGVALASSTNGQDPVVTLWLNDDLQDSVEYDASGRFDLEFTLDRSQIQRDNVLVIRSELPLDCGEELPNHELTLDAGSWVDAEPGQSLPVSLDRFPQVAVGHLSVAVGESDNEMELAMATVGVLQGSSPLPIHPQAAPIERVLAGFSAGLVVTNGEGHVAEAIARDLTTVRSEQLAFVSGESPEDLAFLSTSITETSQDVLVVFSPTDALSATFIEVANQRGWSAFVGNAIGVRGNSEVIRSETPTSASTEAALSTLAEPPEEKLSVTRQFGLGALGSLLLVVGVVMVRFVLGALRRLR